MAKATVLLVDDEVEFATALAERMRRRELEVDTAENGMAALELVKKKAYDAIILDLAMPGLDGLETLKLMLQESPDLQVILLTGQATVEKGVEAVKLGAVEFLEKPAKIELLMEKINEAQTKRTQLSEDHVEDMINDILKRKGW
ncbi:response regulator [candidate division GN15 bacterium]|jgi:DNA-binding NtrC family response regulator|nr:response regulator [candidate division GN15 bacterium]